MTCSPKKNDLEAIAPSLTEEKRLWRSLEELHGDEQLLVSLQREFPKHASRLADGATRRQFLQFMGASLALAGAQGCVEQPQERIVPHVRAPEQLIPGLPLYYATAMTHDDAAVGLLVETHMGRPIKTEGNPRHPAVPAVVPAGPESLIRYGASDVFSQAIVLSLYDPSRSQSVTRAGEVATWRNFTDELAERLVAIRNAGGRGLRILSGNVISPTLGAQLSTLLEELPEARWHQYEPVHSDNSLAGSRLAFGEDVTAIYEVERADAILSLDADFLAEGADHLRHARGFANRRRFTRDISDDPVNMNRLYVVETTTTLTGGAADHRLGVSPHSLIEFAADCARALGLSGLEANRTEGPPAVPAEWLAAVVADLQAARGRSLVMAGRSQPPIVHALAHWMNESLGNVGQTVAYCTPVEARPEARVGSLGSLMEAIGNGEVAALVILGGNPAYDAPADLKFEAALHEIPFSAHLSPYYDETSAVCRWHIPARHLFESWSDTRGPNGMVTVVQPTIAPLYPGKSEHEMVAALGGLFDAESYDLVRDYWRGRFAEGNLAEADNFENWWKIVLHDGIVAGTASPILSPSVVSELASQVAAQLRESQEQPAPGELAICFRPDPSVWDGRFANNAWLQELPRPFTKLTWDNAALVSPQLARERQLETGDLVEIGTATATVRVPVFVLPGQPPSNITLSLGYGRTLAGEVGTAIGTNVYPLRMSAAMWFADVTTLRKTGTKYPLATTQNHHLMEGRHIVRTGTLTEYLADSEHPAFMHVGHHVTPEISIYPEYAYEGYKWGMAVNQSACIGCSACVIACQAENNIPVVGKVEVQRSREMHWLRIDHYYDGPEDSPASYHQPMLCVHCELAPCEPVCPVAATTHSSEGLNEMTYNRCIGTRYCSNNCPYKVRRFNFFDYNKHLDADPIAQLRPNPDVTVRERGVMEKCTYCVQRINAARIAAENEGRRIRDGEVITACQAACPTAAIVFGDLNNAASAVVRAKQSPLNYSVLGDLNTRPRTTHIAAMRNLHPRLATPASNHHGE